ncbi:MAG: hypothetical protein ABF289_06075 [Clostridiales bacterium]
MASIRLSKEQMEVLSKCIVTGEKEMTEVIVKMKKSFAETAKQWDGDVYKEFSPLFDNLVKTTESALEKFAAKGLLVKDFSDNVDEAQKTAVSKLKRF